LRMMMNAGTVIIGNESWDFKHGPDTKGQSRLTLLEESADVETKSQDYVDLLLWLQKDGVCPTLSDWQPEVLSPRFWTSEKASWSCETRIIARREGNTVLQHPLTHTDLAPCVTSFSPIPCRTISSDHGLKPLSRFGRLWQAF
jgi:hypothetical protein